MGVELQPNLKGGKMEIKTYSKSQPQRVLTIRPLALAALAMVVGLGVLGFVASPAWAIQADIGPLKGNLDTTVSVGASFRVESRDPTLVANTNGGNQASANSDDGNLNFAPWNATSLNFKVLHEGQWKWKNYGFFGRFFYFYDWAIMKIDPNFRAFTDQARRYQGSNIVLLDAYLIADWELGSRPLTVRLGNQVVSWGESTFIQGGINSINPVDVSKLRTAGAELKEALIPLPMIHASMDLSGSLSIEGFYQFYWERIKLEPAGTYFSTSDYAGEGAWKAMLGFGMRPPFGVTDNPDAPFGSDPPLGGWIPRRDDDRADNMGQGGIALRYFASWLRDAELGLYWIHIHSRRPLVSGVTGDAPPPVEDTLALSQWALTADYASTGGYYREYPGDINILAASINTEIPKTGTAFQMELSGRLGQPIQIDDVELLFGAISPLDPTLATLLGTPPSVPILGRSQLISNFGKVGFNEYVQGWQRKDMVQAQATFTKVFGPSPLLNTDQSVMLFELGGTWFFGMEDKWPSPDFNAADPEAGGSPGLRYEGPGTFTSGNDFFTNAEQQPYTTRGGFADPFSWGYRLAIRLDYYNLVGPITVQPVFAFFHDVEGVTPTPISNFVEGRKSMTLAIRTDYLNTLKTSISYTMYFGAGIRNQLHDRDFLSISTSLAF
jgi:hypothetical protein